ncbi:MAG: hypothetical protein ABJF23_05825 [Bryobacteraceae bacterium]
MRQALHILKKDVRFLRLEIGLFLTLTVMFGGMGMWWIEMPMLFAAAYLIARVVLGEAIPGANQFWLTRPYDWRSLLAAKVMFVLLFVNLPVCLAQLGVVLANGFPLGEVIAGLLWTQTLLILVLALPVAALASLTAGIMPFIFSLFVLSTIYFFAGDWLTRTAESRWPAAVQWERDAFCGVVISVLTLAVLYLQYRGRRTVLSRALGVAVTAAGASIYWFFPLPLALALQAGTSKPPDYASGLQAQLSAVSNNQFERRRDGVVGIQFPITVTGLPEDVTIRADAIPIVIQGPNGETWRPDSRRLASVGRQTTQSGKVTFHTSILMERDFFNEVGEMPVTLKASIYFSAFGNARSRTIPFQEKPVNVMGGLQCYDGFFDAVTCRSAFRWPGALVYSSFGGNLDPVFQMISYSPFPGELRLHPMESHWSVAAPPRAKEVTIVLKEPVAHFRRDFEIRDVHLPDFAFMRGR